MVQLLRNVYWNSKLDEFLETEKRERGIKTKSALLRNILKERYNLCLIDSCSNVALFHDHCQIHLTQISKKLKKGRGDTFG